VALKALGPNSVKAGEFSVLRVLATFPATPHADTLTNLVEADKSKHPAATLNVESLATQPPAKEILESLRQGVVEAAIRNRKRKSDHHEARRSKRQKGQKNAI
jgi:hypothetical protein